MTEAFVLGGVRTPFARCGGSLSHIRLDDLLGLAMRGACEPHIGYVAEDLYRTFYGDVAASVEAWLDKDEASRSRS